MIRMNSVTEHRRIAVPANLASSYCRGVVKGVVDYARHHTSWMLIAKPTAHREVLANLRDLECDGVIAPVGAKWARRRLVEADLPTVNVAESRNAEGFATVTLDSRAAGRMAGEYLLAQGHRNFAFVSHGVRLYSMRRQDGFAEAVEQAGCACAVLTTDPAEREGQVVQLNRMERWLRDLPRPCGLLAADEGQARDVLEAARRASVAVPDELAVVSIGIDDLLIDITHPALSSVRLPLHRIGYEAAALLSRLLTGAAPPAQPALLEPLGIDARLSSDLLAIEDEGVAAAVRFIRGHADQPIQVGNILEAVAVSRRSLERRFRQVLGRSPQSEIQRVHLQRARQLLIETSLAMPDVAERSGFRNADRLAAAFRRIHRVTPTAFRRQHRTS
jgi:LacI family transcriptional regulator